MKHKIDARVSIERMGNDKTLEGRKGSIVGKSYDDILTIYIVMLDDPVLNDDGTIKARAVTITEHCLDPEA